MGRYPLDCSPPSPQIHDHVMHNNDRLNATAKRKGGGREREREREIRGKGNVLDAYHQRELKSCNRSKKHPWAVKSRSGGGEGNAKEKVCSVYILGDRLCFKEGGEAGPIKLSTGIDSM